MASSRSYSPPKYLLPPRDAKEPLVVPVGVSFGPTELEIAFTIPIEGFRGLSAHYTHVPCGDIYKTFYKDLLRKKVQCNHECCPGQGLATSFKSPSEDQVSTQKLVHTFSGHISFALDIAARGDFDHPAVKFRLMAATVPDHWGKSTRTLVADSFRMAGHPLDGSHMMIPLSRAVGIVERFHSFKGCGSDHPALILEYNKSYLHLMLIDRSDCSMKAEMYYPNLGEDKLHKVFGTKFRAVIDGKTSTCRLLIDRPSEGGHDQSDPSNDICSGESATNDDTKSRNTLCHGDASDWSLIGFLPIVQDFTRYHSKSEDSFVNEANRDSFDRDSLCMRDEYNNSHPLSNIQRTHTKHIVDAISEFLIRTIASETPNSILALENTAGNLRRALRDVTLQALVTGEASVESQIFLRATVQDMFVEENRVRVSGPGPSKRCGAVGARILANQQVQNPKHMNDWKDLPGYQPGDLASR